MTTAKILGQRLFEAVKKERQWQEIANQGIHIEAQLRKELLTIEVRTIECCAQVADNYAKRMKGPEARTAEWIRDDIRALKDKP